MYVGEDFISKIQNLKKQGKYIEALNLVNQMLSKDPTNEELLMLVTDLQYSMWELDKASKPIEFLLKYKWEYDHMVCYAKWVLEMEKTNWEEARKYLKQANILTWEQNPEILRCYWLAEYWYWNKEKWIQLLEKANYVAAKQDAEILYNLIEIYLLERQYNKAKKIMDYFEANKDRLKYFEKWIWK